MKIELKSRDQVGTSSAKAARRQNLTPATIYGGSIDSSSVLIKTSDLDQILREQGSNAVFDVVLDGDKESQVMFANIQRDPVKDDILNVELRHLEAGQKVQVTIRIDLQDTDRITDATINQNMMEIDIVVAPADIPSAFTLSVEGMEIGDTKVVSDLDIPESVEVLAEADEPVVSIAAPKVEVEETDEEEVDPAMVETTEQAPEEVTEEGEE